MPQYDYQALDRKGRQVTGSLFGSNADRVAEQLASQGYSQVRVADPATAEPSPHREGPRTIDPPVAPETGPRNYVATNLVGPLVGKVSLAHLSFFFRQLGTMLNAGVGPSQALDTLAKQAQSPKLAHVVREMREHVIAGRPISAGVQRYPEVFSPLTVSLIRAGEEGGFVDSTMHQIADYMDREIALRNLIRRATIYPKLVLGASIVIFIAANSIIKSLAPNSPVSLSSPLTDPKVWMVLAPVLIGLFLFMRVGMQNPRVKYNWDLFVSYLPGFGKTTKQFAMAKFGRALGALYKGGVPIHKAFQLSADACGNEYLRAKMAPAFRTLETGAGITETLRNTGAFSEIVLNMTDTGEQTGNLDQMLEKMSEFYEGEAEVRSVQMGWALGVLALLMVAAYVGYLFISNISGVVNKTYGAAGL